MSEERKTLYDMIQDSSVNDSMVFCSRNPISPEPLRGRTFYVVYSYSSDRNVIDILMASQHHKEPLWPHLKDAYMPELTPEDARAIMHSRQEELRRSTT